MAKTRVTLYVDADYGLLLRTIENLVDGTTVTFANGPLFRVVTRDSVSGNLLICEPSPLSQVPFSAVGDPQAYNGNGMGMGVEPDTLGARHGSIQQFSFGPFPDGRFLYAFWMVEILQAQPDRVRFSTYCFWNDFSQWSVLWLSPILLQLDPLPQDHYFIGVNGGLVTQNPQVDLVGNGDDYQFAASARFEPEVNLGPTDRMEADYPRTVGCDLSAYGSRATKVTILSHGNLSGKTVRYRDFYDEEAVATLLDTQTLVQDGLLANNNGQVSSVASSAIEAHRYIRCFTIQGDVLGEEVGIDWRRWLVSSVEGATVLPTRARDRAEMARYTKFPLWLQFGNEDTEFETQATLPIADEYRQMIPAPWSTALPRYCRAVLDPQEQDASGKRPAQVNDVIPSLFDLANDPTKQNYTTVLRSNKSLFTVSAIIPRRPAPYDGDSFWTNYDGSGGLMDTARVKDSFEAALGGAYLTSDAWLVTVSLIASFFFDGTYTWIRPIQSFDKTHFARQTTYAKAGHAAHSQHLGFLNWVHAATPYAYPIEAVVQPQFLLNFVAVAGDITANLGVLDPIAIYWISGHFLPGCDRFLLNQIGSIAGTSICSYADDYGSGVGTPAVGPLFLLGTRTEAKFSEYLGSDSGAGLLLEQTHEDPVCWNSGHPNYPHAQSGNHQLVGWKRVLTGLRTRLQGSNGGQWMQFDDAGPIDLLIGQLDGSSNTFRTLTLTTKAASWGASPFFVTALQDFVRTGFYENGGHGHLDKSLLTNDFAREAVLYDWMLASKLMTIGHVASSDGVTGSRPDGQPSYTPFNSGTTGVENKESISSLFARLLNAQDTFGLANFNGQRMRSLIRLSTTSDPSSVSDPAYVGHDIGSHETGTTRPYLMHVVFADPVKRRKIIVVIANPSASTRGDSFRFDASRYKGLVPGHIGAFQITRYEFEHDDVTITDKGLGRGAFEISEQLAPSGVVAYTFELVSGLRFIHRYDDDDFEEIDVPHQLTHARVEPITGQGSRFQYGFVDYHPDDDIKIASMDLRVFLLGRSENK